MNKPFFLINTETKKTITETIVFEKGNVTDWDIAPILGITITKVNITAVSTTPIEHISKQR